MEEKRRKRKGSLKERKGEGKRERGDRGREEGEKEGKSSSWYLSSRQTNPCAKSMSIYPSRNQACDSWRSNRVESGAPGGSDEGLATGAPAPVPTSLAGQRLTFLGFPFH